MSGPTIVSGATRAPTIVSVAMGPPVLLGSEYASAIAVDTEGRAWGLVHRWGAELGASTLTWVPLPPLPAPAPAPEAR